MRKPVEFAAEMPSSDNEFVEADEEMPASDDQPVELVAEMPSSNLIEPVQPVQHFARWRRNTLPHRVPEWRSRLLMRCPANHFERLGEAL